MSDEQRNPYVNFYRDLPKPPCTASRDCQLTGSQPGERTADESRFRGQGRLTRISREESESRFHERANQRRQAENTLRQVDDERRARELDRYLVNAPTERKQPHGGGIQYYHNGKRVDPPALTEGDSIEIKMPGESVFTRIFAAVIGKR